MIVIKRLIAVTVFLFVADLKAQIVDYYPQTDTVFIGFGCTAPILNCQIRLGYFDYDSILISPGWNTGMQYVDSSGHQEWIDSCIIKVLPPYQSEYEIWYRNLSSEPPVSFQVPIDSPVVYYFSNLFTLSLYVIQQDSIIDSLAFLFKAIIGLETDNNNWSTPLRCELLQNYPNPFNPKTTIGYFLPKQSYVKIVLLDLLGNYVQELFTGYQNAQFHEIEFDGSGLPSGVYFYRLETDEFVDIKKCVLIK